MPGRYTPHRLVAVSIPRILVPARPGITNAGCVVADIRHDFVRTVNRPLDSIEMKIRDVLAEQIAEGQRLIKAKRLRWTTPGFYTAPICSLSGKRAHLHPNSVAQTPKEEMPFETAYFNRFQVDCRKYAQIW